MPHRTAEHVGREALILALAEQGLSQSEIARRVGRTPARVNQILRDHDAVPVADHTYLLLVRDIWASITRQPNLPAATLAKRHDTSVSTVQRAINHLEARGYVRTAPGRGNARVVVLPLYEC